VGVFFSLRKLFTTHCFFLFTIISNERELLDEFMSRNQPKAESMKPSKGRTSISRKADIVSKKKDDDDEEDEVAEEPTKKRGRHSKAASKRDTSAASMDVDEPDEGAPPPKKKTRITPEESPERSASPNARKDDGFSAKEHSPDIMKPYEKMKSWESILDSIETVEHKDNELLCYFTTYVFSRFVKALPS
jgi:hypothetical protein